MAIQSFSVGQVLTAAQVNALQANDYNQTVSNKTASYTLVAADKGTRVTMSSTSATTITVNTSLFSAGDTLFIQNLNTGVSTITAGTATVTSSASLALAQWEGGTLYFTSASAAIFIKGAGAAASSGGMTLLSTTTLSGSGITVSSISQDYKHLYLVLRGVYTAVGGQTLSIRFNGDTGSNYAFVKSSGRSSDGAFSCTGSSSTSSPALADIFASSTYSNMVNMDMTIPRYTESNKKTMFALTNQYDSATLILCQNVVMWNDTSAITSITLNTSGSTFSGGTLYIYGVN
jgi:hypothetical protein